MKIVYDENLSLSEIKRIESSIKKQKIELNEDFCIVDNDKMSYFGIVKEDEVLIKKANII